jgi:hypothetical protein
VEERYRAWPSLENAMTGWFRLLFLFSSWAPLYVVVALALGAQKHAQGAAIALALATAAVFVFLFLRARFKRAQPYPTKVEPIEQLDENIIGYMLAYIPPVLIDDYASSAKVWPAVAFYLIIATLMMRTDTINVNPLFLFFRYRLHRARLPSGRAVTIITRRDEVVAGEVLNLYEVQTSRLYFAE